VARYFHDNVSQSIDELLAGSAGRHRQGEFRRVDIESAVDVITAPILMREIWKRSMAPFSCRVQQIQKSIAHVYRFVVERFAVKE